VVAVEGCVRLSIEVAVELADVVSVDDCVRVVVEIGVWLLVEVAVLVAVDVTVKSVQHMLASQYPLLPGLQSSTLHSFGLRW
jgi:hypothetical protein